MQLPGIYVEIKGDYSDLQKKLRAAKELVAQQATGISNALNNALSPDKVKSSINALVGNFSQLSRASSIAGTAFDNIAVDLGDLRKTTGLTEQQFAKLQAQLLKTQASNAQEAALKRIAAACNLTEKEIRELGRQFGLSSAQIEKVTGATKVAGSSLASFGNIAKGALAYFSVYTLASSASGLVRIADSYSLLSGRLKLVTDGQEDLIRTEAQLYQMAQQTRASYETTVGVYTRFARATEDTGIAQAELMRIVEGLNKALIVSGATSVEAEAAMLQLSQGLASGRLSGEELRSVLEQLPRVARMLADGLGQPVGKLKEFGEEGRLTTDVVLKALGSQVARVSKEFEQMPTTVSQAGTVLRNTLNGLVDDANKGSGATNNLANTILNLAKTTEENKSAMLDFFNGIVTAAGWAVDRVATLTNAVKGLAAVTAGELSVVDFAGMNPAELRQWMKEYDTGTATLKKNINEAAAAVKKFREEDPSLVDDEAWTSAERKLERLQKEFDSLTNKAKETGNVINLSPDGVKQKGIALPGGKDDTKKKIDEAARAQRALNQDIAAGLRFREAQAELSENVFAKEIAKIDEERQRFIASWADKAKTAEEKQQRITEITEWYSGARAKVEKEEAQKIADARRSALESELSLQEARLERRRAEGSISELDALREEFSIVEEKQQVLSGFLEKMDKLKDVSAYYAQAEALERVNTRLATLGQRMRLADTFEAVKQGLRDVADNAIQSGEAIRNGIVNAFASIDDAIVQLVTKGKIDFKSMADSIIADFTRIASQKYITGPLASGLSSLLGGFLGGSGGGSTISSNFSLEALGFHNSGIVGVDAPTFSRSIPSSTFTGARRYHSGLMPDEFPAILQRGEGVFTKAQMAAMGEAQRSNIVVNVIESPGKGGEQQQRQVNGVNFIDVFVEKIKASIASDIATGGGIVPTALANTYGLNRATR